MSTASHATVPPGWLASFADHQLKSLVAEALAHNHDLHITAARLEAALADAVATGADRWPAMNAGGQASRSREVTEAGAFRYQIRQTRYSLSLDVTWELDLWGKLKDRALAGRARATAAGEDLLAARLLLAAKVTKAWLDAVAAQLQTELAEKTVDSYYHTTRKIRARFQKGLATALDLRLALTDLANARALLQAQKDQRQKALRGLQLLLGRYPDSEVALATDLPPLPPPAPAGLPSQLLSRRPDIRASQQRVIAADKQHASTTKALLPSLTLTTAAGTISPALRNLLSTNHGLWNLVAGLTQPLFTGGRLRAFARRADAEARAAWLGHGKTVLAAFTEVEQALTTETLLIGQRQAVQEAACQAEEARQLAWAHYSAGVTDIITVLSAQRRVLEARGDRISLQHRLLHNRVDLHLALGGDF